MSPSYQPIVRAFALFVGALQLPWSKPQRGNLIQLGAGFAHDRSLPLRRLARVVAGPGRQHRHWDKRLRRFLGNPKLDRAGALRALLRFLLPRFAGLPFVPVMIDWTYLGRARRILWCQIPYRGRAFPLCCRAFPWTPGGDPDGTQTAEELALLAELAACWPAEAPPPLLLADRGFPKVPLLAWLQEQGWYFLIRSNTHQWLTHADGTRVAPEFPAAGGVRGYAAVHVFRERLPVSVVLARHPAGKARWLLLTNLPPAHWPQAPALYAHRMQPEQIHRDCKRGHFVGGFALGHLGRMHPERLQNLLFCVGLWYAFLILLAETQAETRAWLKRRHWGLSLTTLGLDLVHHLGTQLREATKQALATVKLKPLWLETGDS